MCCILKNCSCKFFRCKLTQCIVFKHLSYFSAEIWVTFEGSEKAFCSIMDPYCRSTCPQIHSISWKISRLKQRQTFSSAALANTNVPVSLARKKINNSIWMQTFRSLELVAEVNLFPIFQLENDFWSFDSSYTCCILLGPPTGISQFLRKCICYHPFIFSHFLWFLAF